MLASIKTEMISHQIWRYANMGKGILNLRSLMWTDRLLYIFSGSWNQNKKHWCTFYYKELWKNNSWVMSMRVKKLYRNPRFILLNISMVLMVSSVADSPAGTHLCNILQNYVMLRVQCHRQQYQNNNKIPHDITNRPPRILNPTMLGNSTNILSIQKTTLKLHKERSAETN